ncbi:MAG: hypothetical protein E6R05_06000 [Candidatus Moraniibacteriota bacterium]|nr:MAG: hypothetical protein E6R05_06000 [Candidatus Moranbacteria bacterium]
MIQKLIPIMVFAVFGFYLMGGLFSAKLGMIDDHEIPYFLGSDGRITLSELPGVIGKTEIGAWGEYLRFRPSYYTLRVLETMLWRDNATLWFAARYVLLVLSMWMGFSVMTVYFPKILSYLFIFYTLTMPFWADILTRLGPSETYAVLALVVFAYGWQFEKSVLVFLGYILGIGSKENILFLFPLLLVWTGIKILNKTLTRKELMGILLSIGFTTWVVGGIVLATNKAGADIYGAPISYRYRVTRFVWDIPKIIAERSMYFSVATALILSIGSMFKIYRKKVLPNLICLLLVLMCIASQYIFYPNTIPNHSRYDYPALLLIRIADLVAIVGLLKIVSSTRLRNYIKGILYLLLGLYTLMGIYRYGYIHTLSRSETVVSATNSFDNNINKIMVATKSNENAIFVFVSERYIDFEPVSSVVRYLNARQVKNRIEFKYTPQSKLSDPLGIHLEKRLIGAMNGENKEELFERFDVYSDPKNECYSITFGYASALPNCPEIVRF